RMNCERFRVDLRELAVRAVSHGQRFALAVIPQTRRPSKPEFPDSGLNLVRTAKRLLPTSDSN
ncbi:MAG TPA: hypothetical protein VGO27_11800, partial [Candidatus Acidoferrum sp.]|nr:hypothetical protein [Candidatus Acidoferrum sp.]